MEILAGILTIIRFYVHFKIQTHYIVQFLNAVIRRIS